MGSDKEAKSRSTSRLRVSIGAIACLFLIGCAINPEPISRVAQEDILAADRARAAQDVEPVGPMLSMHEAIARGLKYNLEHRSKIMEQALVSGILDVSRYDMLPALIANAGYNYRNNFFITEASGAYSGNPSLNEPFVNSDKSFGVAGLALNWSVLDFGVSYYNAKQNADMVLVAAEQRRRSMHLLVQDIQIAYLRAASAQKLRDDIEVTVNGATQAIHQSRANSQEGLQNPLETLRYQKSLLDNIKILRTVHQELASALIQLNQLINLPPNTQYLLEDVDMILPPSTFADISAQAFEERAIAQNADIKESIYQTRIAVLETKKAMLNMLPGLTFNYGPQTSNNSFYINRNWVEGSAQLSFNLWNLLLVPQVQDNAQAAQRLAEEKRMMVQMAVISQVYLARQQLDFASDLYQQSAEIEKIDSKIAALTREKFREGTASDAEKVAADASAILNRLRKYEALSQFYAASARLQATAGLEPDIVGVQQMPLRELTNAIKTVYQDWINGVLPPDNIDQVIERLQISATEETINGTTTRDSL